MPLGIGLGIGFHDLAVRPDQHGKPCWLFLIRAFSGTIGHRHRTIGVTQEVCRQTCLVEPCFQVFRRAERYAEQRGVFVFEFLGSITEPLGFFGSPTAERAGEKPDQHVPSGVIGKVYGLAVLIGQGKAVRVAANFRESHCFLVSLTAAPIRRRLCWPASATTHGCHGVHDCP